MADTPTGETATPEVLENKVTPTVTPPAVTPVDNGEAEKLRKELEQARMRESQLTNQLKAKEEADAQLKAKELEEQNQFKELYEQEKTKREAIESEQQTKEREAELEKAKQEALSGFSDDVKSLATELGFELTDADESSVEQFKGKLDKLSQKVGSETKVTPNNPGQSSAKIELTTEQLQRGLQEETSFHDIVTKRFPGIAAMTAPRK